MSKSYFSSILIVVGPGCMYNHHLHLLQNGAPNGPFACDVTHEFGGGGGGGGGGQLKK